MWLLFIIFLIFSLYLTVKKYIDYKKYTYNNKIIFKVDILKEQQFSIIENTFINIVVLLTFAFLKYIHIQVTYIYSYSPFIHIIWWLIFTNKSSESMSRHIELLLRIYFVTQILLFCVQFDQFVNWQWPSIFLPSWILLSSLAFYIFGLIILFLCSIYYYVLGQTDKY